jgi:hypothetical protein
MTKDLARHFALVLGALSLLWACAGASAAGPREPPPPSSDDEPSTPDAVRAGQYRLSLTMTCRSRVESATGVLTLQPMSGDEAANDASLPSAPEAALLWGQTDLDLERFLRCLGRAASRSDEPIHPSVLVEVLRWDGERHHQVLLVSTASATSAQSSNVGVAMWVERAEHGHLGGVWSRWELMGRGEGRWEAEFLPAR